MKVCAVVLSAYIKRLNEPMRTYAKHELNRVEERYPQLFSRQFQIMIGTVKRHTSTGMNCCATVMDNGETTHDTYRM
jgi:hypothetical protein